jgi:hypothetical protein
MNALFRPLLRPLLKFAIALLWLGSLPAFAHKPSDSYLALSIAENRISGQWDIALRDLDMAIGLDRDDNGELTWDEIRAKHSDIAAFALARLALSSEGRNCPLNVTQHLVDHHSDGAYAVLRLAGECAGDIESIGIDYRLLFDLDPQHKGLLKLASPEHVTTAIFSPERAKQQFVLAEPSMLAQFIDYLKHGVWHIWIGFDHILFLLSLLLPAVLVYHARKWHASDSFKASFIDVLKIVTAFTVAHSITLTLAALGIVALPSRWVEAAIAASVVIAALNNVFPLFQGRRWVAAFVFGLIHGFGFASVLADLGLPQSALVLALLGFNLGVEIGQLAIVAVFLPLAYALRKTWFYQRLVLLAGSVLIALIAAVWFVERAFDLQLISS